VTVIAVTSFAGSPGVTTAAVAIAVNWPRPVVLLEADISGVSSVMAGFFRANLLPTVAGLDKVAVAFTRNILAWPDILDPDTRLSIAVHDLPVLSPLPIPELPAGHRLWVIPGFVHLSIIDGVRALWARLPALLRALSDNGVDVIVDLGRLHIDDVRLPILDQADTVLVCAEGTMVDLNRLYRRLELPDMSDRLEGIGRAEKFRILLRDAPAEPVRAGEFTRHLMPVLATLPFDPQGAAPFSVGKPDPRPARNKYRQAICRTVAQLSEPSRSERSSTPATQLATPAADGAELPHWPESEGIHAHG
jgi:hypothetical protein